MSVVAIVVGAGRGERLGDALPKALVRLGGQRLVARTARALAAAPEIDAVQLVLPADHLAVGEELRADWSGPARLLAPVAGGATRQASVTAGLRAACDAQAPEWVLVHDAARCLVRPADAAEVLAAARETGAALPIAPVADTLKCVADGRVVQTPDRSRFGLALTPQAFRTQLLAEALEKAARDGFAGTDCASLVERLDVEVRVVPGRPENFKITGPADLRRAEALLDATGEGAA